MKFHYYPETDSLYIDLAERPAADSREVTPDIVVDFDESGRVVGIDIQHASTVANLERLEVDALPLASLVMA